MSRPLYKEIASLLQARQNCSQKMKQYCDEVSKPLARPSAVNYYENASKWFDNHTEKVCEYVRNYLPHGSGFDAGTKIDLEASHANKLVFYTDFHHMSNAGFYDGWTEHTITVTPSLAFGIHVRISGRNRNDIKEYLHSEFSEALEFDLEPLLEKERNEARQKKELQRAFRFFFEHAGYVVGQRAVGALLLARAEQYAEDHEWKYEGSQDADGLDSLGDHEYWCSNARRVKAGYTSDGEYVGTRRITDGCEHEVMTCVLKDSAGNVLEALGGIIDPDSAYMRVVRAELALEAMARDTENEKTA